MSAGSLPQNTYLYPYTQEAFQTEVQHDIPDPTRPFASGAQWNIDAILVRERRSEIKLKSGLASLDLILQRRIMYESKERFIDEHERARRIRKFYRINEVPTQLLLWG